VTEEPWEILDFKWSEAIVCTLCGRPCDRAITTSTEPNGVGLQHAFCLACVLGMVDALPKDKRCS
jgi:hypothetical protein